MTISTYEMLFAQYTFPGLVGLALLLGSLYHIARRRLLKKQAVLNDHPGGSFRGAAKAQSAMTTEFTNHFPPSRRQALLEGTRSRSIAELRILERPCAADATFRTCQLPSYITPDLDKPGRYTPTGFSTMDIKDIGSFPDYSILSGVRRPQPCPDFDIKTAEFRPFRPFRFAYHQTMC